MRYRYNAFRDMLAFSIADLCAISVKRVSIYGVMTSFSIENRISAIKYYARLPLYGNGNTFA